MIQHFKAEGRFDIRGRGLIFTGPCPFEIDKALPGWAHQFFYTSTWIVDFDETTKGKLWRVTSIESFATGRIRLGQSIGLVVAQIN